VGPTSFAHVYFLSFFSPSSYLSLIVEGIDHFAYNITLSVVKSEEDICVSMEENCW
jgi:hypothetical protein